MGRKSTVKMEKIRGRQYPNRITNRHTDRSGDCPGDEGRGESYCFSIELQQTHRYRRGQWLSCCIWFYIVNSVSMLNSLIHDKVFTEFCDCIGNWTKKNDDPSCPRRHVSLWQRHQELSFQRQVSLYFITLYIHGFFFWR